MDKLCCCHCGRGGGGECARGLGHTSREDGTEDALKAHEEGLIYFSNGQKK